MTREAGCSFCNHPDESISHVVRECSFVKDVWSIINGIDTNLPIWREQLPRWLSFLLNHEKNILLATTVWFLWKERHARIFSGSKVTASSTTIRINNWSNIVMETMNRELILGNSTSLRMNCNVAWDPGPADWITVNTDGVVNLQTGKAAAGGLIRDEFGHCLKTFALNLGACSMTRAKMRGAIAGLYFAWDLGFHRIQLQMDSKAAIALFSDEDDVNSST
ncbi:Putative ribonuclease H protein At1g65750 [Linum perenne]